MELARLVFVNRRFEVPLLFSSNRPANHVTGDCANHAATSHTRLPYHAVSTTSFVLTLHRVETWYCVEITCIARSQRDFLVPGSGVSG